MNKEKLQALISLLDDPDQTVYEQVEKLLLQEDTLIIDQLEQAWETSLDQLAQSRIEKLVQQLQIKETSEKIKSWSQNKDIDLFEGFFLISQYQYPDLKAKYIRSKIQKISSDVWLEINNKLTSIEKITVLNHLFYDVNKFSVNVDNLQAPQNCYLNQLLETKKGNMVSIAILYALVARELGFPVQLIDFPRNPLLAYIDPDTARKAHGKDYNSPVLFYINPSNRGAIIGRKEIEFFLNKNEEINDERYFLPCEDRVIIKKLIASLIDAYDYEGNQDKVNDLSAIAELL